MDPPQFTIRKMCLSCVIFAVSFACMRPWLTWEISQPVEGLAFASLWILGGAFFGTGIGDLLNERLRCAALGALEAVMLLGFL